MFAVIARLCAVLVVFVAAQTTARALPVKSPAPASIPAACACAAPSPAAAYVIVPGATDKSKSETALTEGNAYTLASTVIWAFMWVAIARIARDAIAASLKTPPRRPQ